MWLHSIDWNVLQEPVFFMERTLLAEESIKRYFSASLYFLSQHYLSLATNFSQINELMNRETHPIISLSSSLFLGTFLCTNNRKLKLLLFSALKKHKLSSIFSVIIEPSKIDPIHFLNVHSSTCILSCSRVWIILWLKTLVCRLFGSVKPSSLVYRLENNYSFDTVFNLGCLLCLFPIFES